MKAKSLLLACLILVACESDHILTEKMVYTEIEEVENPNVLTEAESIEEANLFLSQLASNDERGVTLRSRSKGAVGCRVSTRKVSISLTRSANERSAYQTVPVHTIEYKNEENKLVARAVTIADQRFTDKVVAFIEEGKVDLCADGDAGFLEELMDEYIRRVVNGWETAKNLDPPPDNVVQRPPVKTPKIYYRQLDTRYNWHQLGSPYTDYTPFRNGVRASAGCNAVAMGMIMAWHQWPLQGSYPRYEKEPGGAVVLKDRYPVYSKETWALFHSDDANELLQTDLQVRGHVADLLAEIGYKMNTDYISATAANIYPDFACTVFPQMGYHCDEAFSQFDLSSITREIYEERPVFLAGLREGGYGHSAVISGVATRSKYAGDMPIDTDDVVYVYILNGNAGAGDGWFSADLFRSDMPKAGDSEDTSSSYPYRFRCKILTHITPDYTNAGSKEQWRVSNVRDY